LLVGFDRANCLGALIAAAMAVALAGLMAVIGSILLFGLGTLAALPQHRWNQTG
jgi:hypothetical protein